ncbi:hypothetical protein SAMN06273572_105255 [Monaibacterium marinum]|uniref:Imelysin-like domain-containing protein n=1 Tax=Pontivivens marinum TaxID=1690039 RepID=A0A2C9CWK7_9RHOB|nr:imelysin family protein [Monaibacterium marinum]SOH94829.1 hypothetical protein SAMN06273572_105255 [Monaibacterium marinum]
MRLSALYTALFLPVAAFAQTDTQINAGIVDQIVEGHILPGFATFESSTVPLAAAQCDAMTAPYQDSFDAWMGVSHLRFGPSEQEERAFALAFWPDTRGATPSTLNALLAEDTPIAEMDFSEVSIAARGFFALDWLLYDPQAPQMVVGARACDLAEAIADDINRIAVDLNAAWQDEAALLSNPGAGGNYSYLTYDESLRTLYGSLINGLDVTAEQRLGRPMGTVERPRPIRAEARRSERSQRNVVLSIAALSDLADPFAEFAHDGGDERLRAQFAAALRGAERLPDPTFSDTDTVQGRFRVESVQSRLNSIRDMLGLLVAPALSISQSFNALDGD